MDAFVALFSRSIKMFSDKFVFAYLKLVLSARISKAKMKRCSWCRTFVPFLSYLAGVARGDEDEEKRTLLFELQEMSSEVSRLEKQAGDLQRTAELAREKSSREKEQLQVRSTRTGGAVWSHLFLVFTAVNVHVELKVAAHQYLFHFTPVYMLNWE